MDDVDHVVDGDGPDQTPAVVHHRRRDQVALAEQERHVLLVGFHRDQLHLGVHDLGHRHRPPGAQQAAQRHRAHRFVGGIDDEDVVKDRRQRILFQVGGLAHEVDGLADVPERGHGHQLALHEAAGAVLGVGQALLDEGALTGGYGLQHLLLFGLVQFLDDLDGVVAFQFGDGGRHVRDSQPLDDLVADRLVQLGQDFRVEAVADDIDQGVAFLGAQVLEQVGDVGVMQRRDQVLDPRAVARGQGLDHVMLEPPAGQFVDGLVGLRRRVAFRGVRRIGHDPVLPSSHRIRARFRYGRPGTPPVAGQVNARIRYEARLRRASGTGAVEKTRTSTGLPPQRPQRCASTNSATTANSLAATQTVAVTWAPE